MSMTATIPEAVPAQVLAMSGGYFKGWVTRRKPRLTFRIKEATKFFDPIDMQEELERIERRGLSATPVNVTLRILD